ncbi:MAG: DivIVA domain-containing protein [Oscillospiraceae bacterium]|nr:DivIVA domain-containing protein [Oscillospiraceae bacterium]
MITSQDIRAKGFDKAVFGGYDAASVDQFLENVARTIDDQVREISTLKSKMKILANKVEEYRSTEEAMRLALVSAQQLAAQIEADAKEKAQAILDDATGQSLEILSDLKKQIAAEDAKLDAAKASYAAFMAEAREMCRRQLRFLDELPENVDGIAMPEIEPVESEEEAEIDAIIEELAEVPDLMDIPDQIIEQPAQDSDDFEATLMFSLD